MAGHPGILDTRNRASHREHVAVAHAASFHLNAYLPGLRLGDRTLETISKPALGFGNLGNLHGSFL